MRKITLLFVLAFIGISVSAQVSRKDTIISDFESGYNVTYTSGSGYTSATTYTGWKTWSPYKLIADKVSNPDDTGLNKSSTVLRITAASSATSDVLYSTPKITNGVKISSGSNGYRYFHFKLYRTAGEKMLVVARLYSNNATQHYPLEVNTSIVNRWDTINVDLLNNTGSSYGIKDGNVYGWFDIYPSRISGGTYTIYIDDFFFSNSPYSMNGLGLTTGNKALVDKEKVFVSRLDNNTVKIQTTESDESLNFKIYSIHGQLLKAMDKVGGMGAFEVNLPNNNLYVLHVSGKKGTYTTKF